MKKVLALIVLAFVAACSSKVDHTEGSPEEIRNMISDYKNQVVELNKKIADLEILLKKNESADNYSVAVSVQELEYQPFNHYVQVSGTVEAVNMVNISPETSGQIKAIYVNEGEKVEKGHTLIKLNTSISESTIKELETRLELANTLYDRQKKLWEKNIGSELDYLTAKNNKESLERSLETLKAQLDLSIIKAPFSGVIDDIFLKVGELAMPGMPIMQLVNLDELFINADASEAYITKVKRGDLVIVEFPSYPDIKVELPVFRVGNVVKPANRSFNIQVKMQNQNGMIKPNVVSMIKINDFSEEKALAIPSIIIKNDLMGNYVYIVSENNDQLVATKKYIETGLSYNEQTMVVKGLEPGQRVIINGFNVVSDGIAVKIIGNN